MRVVLLSTLCVAAAGFTSPLLSSHVGKSRCPTPQATLGRRAFAGALIPALFLGANSANAAGMYAGEIRKADQTAIGVSQVEIPAKGEGNKGANIPSVPLDTSGWTATSVIGPNGAKGNSGPNGFYAGGESPKEKNALLRKPGTKGTWARMVTGTAGYPTSFEKQGL